MFRLGVIRIPRLAKRLTVVLAVGLLAAQWIGASPALAKYAAMVVDAHTGKVLHAANADTRNYPASLTKMMTLYLLFEAIDEGRLSKASRLKVSSRAARQPPSKLGLRTGQTITVDTAIRALVIRSANDVAVVVAEALGGTEAKFARLMTAKAKQIGMSRTNFANASGLPNSKQLSTARDMAKLAQSLYFTFPHHYHYFGLTSFRYGKRTYQTHNRVARTYRGADGLKTGYTRASGYNLATSAERGGRRIIGIVFGGRSARSRDAHMVKLLDKAWPNVQSVRVKTPRIKPGAVMSASLPAASGQLARPATPRGQPVVSVQLAALPSAEVPVIPTPAPARKVISAGPKPPALPKLRPTEPALGVPTPKPGLIFASSPQGSEALAKQPLTQADLYRIRGDWAIQVGAYYDREQAVRAVDAATRNLPSLVNEGEEAIVLLKGRKKPIYRARLVGFSEQEARDACRQLKKKRVPCLAVKQDKNAVLALAD